MADLDQSFAPFMHSGKQHVDNTRLLFFALLPGVIATAITAGLAMLVLLVATGLTALALDFALNRLRGRNFAIDAIYNPLIAALILTLLLPMQSTWWMAAAGIAFAIALPVHAFGGWGQQLFHPAMAAYLFLLLSFIDAPGQTDFNPISNAAFLAGGLALLYFKAIPWRIPAALLASYAMFTALAVLAIEAGDSGDYLDLLGHSNNFIMLAAFFVATDKSSVAITPRGQLLFGLLFALLLLALQGYNQDAAALAVAAVLANFLAPTIDLIARPRIFGHRRVQRLPSEEELGR